MSVQFNFTVLSNPKTKNGIECIITHSMDGTFLLLKPKYGYLEIDRYLGFDRILIFFKSSYCFITNVGKIRTSKETPFSRVYYFKGILIPQNIYFFYEGGMFCSEIGYRSGNIRPVETENGYMTRPTTTNIFVKFGNENYAELSFKYKKRKGYRKLPPVYHSKSRGIDFYDITQVISYDVII